MSWTHFDYTSGANPYIAITDDKRDEVIRKWEERGVWIESIPNLNGGDGLWYLVHDKEEG